MKNALALLICLLALAAVARAEPSEMQQRFACMGDAMRLCPQAIPNRERIIQCMATQRSSLSAGCRPVFDASYKALFAKPHR